MNDTIYTYLTEEDKIESNPTRITSIVWSNGASTLNQLTMFIPGQATSTSPTGNFRYYTDVFSSNPDTTSPLRSEFSIAYGNVSGSGAPSSIAERPTYAVYCQFRNLLLNNANAVFTYQTGSTFKVMNHFFAISINRAGFKQRIDPGNWQLTLNSANSITLIDDSNESNDISISNKSVYTLIQGNIGNPSTIGHTYGLFYPNHGIILIDADKLSASQVNGGIGMPVNTSTNVWTNASSRTNIHEFFLTIRNGNSFVMRAEEIINSSHYFIRVKNKNYNYSSNPSFISGSSAQLRFPQFAENPQVYITTIGLYDDNNDLLAVAKLNKPILKNFEREALFKVRLDF